MNKKDIRWIQRFENYKKALSQLKAAVDLQKSRPLSSLEIQGLIQAFEFTHELAWNTLKDIFEYQGTVGILGSRDATREAFQKGLLDNGDIWMEMIKSRNQSTLTYAEATATDIATKITNFYFAAFTSLASVLEKRKNENP